MSDSLYQASALVCIFSLRAVVCLLALCGDRILEQSKSLQKSLLGYAHPVAIFGSLAAFGEGLLNTSLKKTHILVGSSRFWRGLSWSLILVMLAAIVGLALELLIQAVTQALIQSSLVLPLNSTIIAMILLLLAHAFFCAWLISHAALDRHVASIESRLRARDLVGARRKLAHIVGRETKSLSRYAVARAAMESLAENFSDGSIAPLSYYLLFGLPGIFFYKAVNTLDSQFGYRFERYAEFGRFAARLDDIANIVPARISAFGICIAAFLTPKGSGWRAIKSVLIFAPSVITWARGGFQSSPNAPHTEAALAGALNIKLAGERLYKINGETWKVGRWIGGGSARCSTNHISRARHTINYAMLCLCALLVTIAIIFELYS